MAALPMRMATSVAAVGDFTCTPSKNEASSDGVLMV